MSIEVGQKVEGTVTGITNFGAFVALPDNKSGLVHISEVADGFVKDINDLLSVGDNVTVKVLKMTPDGKINLSIRQANENAPKAKPSASHNNAKFQNKKPAFKNSYKADFKQDNQSSHKNDDFDSMMSQFLKESEDRLTSLKKSTEGKRGGRGGRRG